jgi:hypothetical protein
VRSRVPDDLNVLRDSSTEDRVGNHRREPARVRRVRIRDQNGWEVRRVRIRDQNGWEVRRDSSTGDHVGNRDSAPKEVRFANFHF